MARLKVSRAASFKALAEIRAWLSPAELEILKQEYKIVEYLYRLNGLQAACYPLLRWLCENSSIDDSQGKSKRMLSFMFNRATYCFGPVEFALVTGLEFGTVTVLDENAASPLRQYLSTMGVKNYVQLTEFLIQHTSAVVPSHFCRQIAALYLLVNIVFAPRAPKSPWNPRCLQLVEDPSTCNAFPWGKFVYDQLIKEWSDNVWSRNNSEKKEVAGYFCMFPYAVIVWFLECVEPDISCILGVKDMGIPPPRICRWSLPQLKDRKLPGQVIFDKNAKFAFTNMEPTAEEYDSMYYTTAVALGCSKSAPAATNICVPVPLSTSYAEGTSASGEQHAEDVEDVEYAEATEVKH